MLRIGIVGTGWWGKELAKAALSLPDKLEIAGCFSLSEKECADFRDAFGGKIYNSYDDILADPRVDAVLLATPHTVHWRQIIFAAKARKHVFVEKPLALTVETASQAIRACEEQSVTLAVGHNRRFSRVARKMKSIIEAGECGQILHVEANYSGNTALRFAPDYWRAQRDEVPGGGITPMGIHMIDTLTWLLGPIMRLASLCKRRVVSVDIDDTTAVMFELESGVTGSLGCIFAAPFTAYLRLYGTRANMEARDNFKELVIEPADTTQPETRTRFGVDDTLQSELRAFAEACAGESDYPVRPLEALRNVAVVEAIMTSSAAGGSWVRVADKPDA